MSNDAESSVNRFGSLFSDPQSVSKKLIGRAQSVEQVQASASSPPAAYTGGSSAPSAKRRSKDPHQQFRTSTASFLCNVRGQSVFHIRNALQRSRLSLAHSRHSSCPVSHEPSYAERISHVMPNVARPKMTRHESLLNWEDLERNAPIVSVEQQSSFHAILAEELRVMCTRLALEHDNLMKQAEEQLHRLKSELALTKESNRKLMNNGGVHGTRRRGHNSASSHLQEQGRNSCPEFGEDLVEQSSHQGTADLGSLNTQRVDQELPPPGQISDGDAVQSSEAALASDEVRSDPGSKTLAPSLENTSCESCKVPKGFTAVTPVPSEAEGVSCKGGAFPGFPGGDAGSGFPGVPGGCPGGGAGPPGAPHLKAPVAFLDIAKRGSCMSTIVSNDASPRSHADVPGYEDDSALTDEAMHEAMLEAERDRQMQQLMVPSPPIQRCKSDPTTSKPLGETSRLQASLANALQTGPSVQMVRSLQEKADHSPRAEHMQDARLSTNTRVSTNTRISTNTRVSTASALSRVTRVNTRKSAKDRNKLSEIASDRGLQSTFTSASYASFAGNNGAASTSSKNFRSMYSEQSMSAKGFALWPVWLEQDRPSTGMFGPDSSIYKPLDLQASNTFMIPDNHGSSRTAELLMGPISDFMDMFVTRPTSIQRICWDLFSWLVVGYECTMIPLQFFELEETRFSKIATWISRLFWTLDILLSFLTGFQRADGNTTMRWAKVAQNYLFTWFLFDVCLVVMDWAELISSGGSDSSLAAARLGKTLKALRLLRLVRLFRLFRLARVPEAVKAFVSCLRSELTIIVLGIIKIIIFVVVINHFIACAWYGVGQSSKGEHTWLQKNLLEDRGFWYNYGTSFHWSLTQFAGSMEVYPTNLEERFYAVGVLLFAFVTAASVVSSICSSMTRLHIVTAEQATKVTSLQQFLIDNEISRAVALRVQRNAQHALAEQKRNTPESSIELFALVSEPLQIEVHYEMYIPKLMPHPLFAMLAKVSPAMMRGVCHCVVVRLPIMQGDVLFSESEIPPEPTMYFLTSGHMDYHRANRSTKKLHPGNWSSEACLWTPWRHRGSLFAHTDCDLLAFDTAEFQKIAKNGCEEDLEIIRRYGMLFLEQLNTVPREELIDLDDPLLVDIELCVREAFPQRPSLTLKNRWRFTSTRQGGNKVACSIIEGSHEFDGLHSGENPEYAKRLSEETSS